MSYDYSENILVQESSGQLLQQELGWEVAFAYNTEVLGSDGTFGRKTYSEILLSRYFHASLKKLNPWITQPQLEEAEMAMKSCLATASLLQINKEKYELIRNGIPVSVTLPDGRSEERRARVIDFDNPENNHFLAIKEMKIHGELYRRRTDIVGFVNGLPLLFVELKKPTVDVENAYTDNYTDYLDTIPKLFHYNAFLILSNGIEARVGTLGSKYAFFHEWKRLAESDQGNVALETMLRGICRKENFLDLLENFILFDRSGGKLVKILARNHQYLGVNEAVKAYADRKLRNGKLGVFWHTQGSGKSYSMLFLAQKIRRKFSGSPSFVILTDREELNTQISETFENCGLLGDTKAARCIATSGSDLVQKLRGNPSFIFTLIQKFNLPDVPPITPDHDIIIMSDEAHRSQYGLLADNMCRLLPTASRIGFTGTPLLANDNITERTFGGYISIYDFQRAVDDHATVPLYYENRGERLENITNPAINDRILDAIENADIDPSQQERLEREFAKEIHLLTATPRLESIARDFVRHYSDLWTSGKAMFVCLNKVTCVRMYNLVLHFWQEEKKEVARQMAQASQQEAQELSRKLDWMEQTEMAVVISQEQNEIQKFRSWELDILPHREKMEKRELDKEFKDAANPLRVVFVCAMWLTGFDVRSLSCLYLDKPLKAHTLMQAIARANRVAEGKSNGLIIDYVGIVKALRKALADYTAHGSGSGGGSCPAVEKKELLSRIQKDLDLAEQFLSNLGIVLADIVNARNFDKINRVQEAANAVCIDLKTKKTFQSYVNELLRLFKYVNREDFSDAVRAKRDALEAILGILQTKRKHADNEALKAQINAIVSDYVSVENTNTDIGRQFDISKIDFTLLQTEFTRSKRQNLILKDLEESIQQQLAVMVQVNPGRIDFYERYQKIIEDYNKEQDRASIETTFMELVALAKSLDDERNRYIREGFSSEEELRVFDLLRTENLSAEDIKAIKEIAKNLLAAIKDTISEMDHWTEKQETRDAVVILIRDILWRKLPKSFPDESISGYQDKVYEYVLMRYNEVA